MPDDFDKSGQAGVRRWSGWPHWFPVLVWVVIAAVVAGFLCTPAKASDLSLGVVATAYCDRGVTSSGVLAGPGVIAADPRVFPIGTVLSVPGWGVGTVLDTGGAIKGNRIDLWMASCWDATYKWGRVPVVVTVLNASPTTSDDGAGDGVDDGATTYVPDESEDVG